MMLNQENANALLVRDAAQHRHESIDDHGSEAETHLIDHQEAWS